MSNKHDTGLAVASGRLGIHSAEDHGIGFGALAFVTHRRLVLGSALLLFLAAVSVSALVWRSYQKATAEVKLVYTQVVKTRDITESARSALAALEAAEVNAQNYVLTGETVYAAAYTAAVRSYHEEFGTLELVAVNDPATPVVEAFSQAGTRTLDELAAVVSLYDKSGSEAAFHRIRKSSAIVYLSAARDRMADVRLMDRQDETAYLVTRAVISLRRLAQAAGALFLLALGGMALLLIEMRGKEAKHAS